jgi:hypothetical protein
LALIFLANLWLIQLISSRLYGLYHAFCRCSHTLYLGFNPLKPQKREKRKWRHYVQCNGGGDKFTTTKVLRQCPLVLQVKVGWRGSKTVGSGEGREMKSGAKREVEQGPSALN